MQRCKIASGDNSRPLLKLLKPLDGALSLEMMDRGELFTLELVRPADSINTRFLIDASFTCV